MTSPRQSHARPKEPFLPADEVEEIDAEPISSEPAAPVTVTLESLAALVAQGFAGVHEDTRMIRREILQLREDLSPRMAAVERKSVPAQARSVALAGTKWGMIALGVLTTAAQIASAFYPKAVGPIQGLLQLLSGTPQ